MERVPSYNTFDPDPLSGHTEGSKNLYCTKGMQPNMNGLFIRGTLFAFA